MKTNTLPQFSALILLAILAQTAVADDSHYQRYVIGDRSGGMGGLAVAGGHGVDACYYNPAGLTLSDRNSLSLSGNIYGVQRYKLKSGLIGGDDIDSDSFSSIPATMGGVWRLSPEWVFAFSAIQPDRSSVGEITARNHGSRIYSYSNEEQSLWIGPSLAWSDSSSLSVGASLYLAHYSYKGFEDAFARFGDEFFAAHTQYSNLSLLAILGVQWALPENWRVGLSVQTPTIPISDDGKIALAEYDIPVSFYSDDLDAKNEIPVKVALGLVRQVPKQYAYGIDVSYHASHDHKAIDVDFEGFGNISLWVHRRDIVDINIGGEYYVTEHFPLRAGFYTSFSAADDIEVEDAMVTSDIDLYGVTLSVGYEDERQSTNVGLNLMYGDGYDIGGGYDVNGNYVSRRVDASESHAFLYVSTSFFL